MLYWHYRHSKKMGGGEEVMKVIVVRQLVNRPLSPVGISEDNALGWKKIRTALEALLLGQLWNCFGLSIRLEHYPSIQQRTRKGLTYFITLRIISQSERTKLVPEHFFLCVCVCVSLCWIVIQHFISPSLVSAKKYSFVLHDRLKI